MIRYHDQVPAWRRGHRPGHHDQLKSSAANICLGATTNYMRRITSGTAGNGLGTTIKYLRQTTSGAAGNGRAQRSSTCGTHGAAPRAMAWAPQSSTWAAPQASAWAPRLVLYAPKYYIAGKANTITTYLIRPQRSLQNRYEQSPIPVTTPLRTAVLGDVAAPPSTITKGQSSTRPVQYKYYHIFQRATHTPIFFLLP